MHRVAITVAAALLMLAGPQHQRRDGRIAELLIVDLGGDGFCFTSAREGVALDYDEDRTLELTGWTCPSSDDSFIVVDQNQTGRIENAAEILGGIAGPPNGFAYLQVFDGYPTDADLRKANRGAKRPNGVIDGRDAIFERLVLWTDANHNGRSEEPELQSMIFAGFSSIDLNIVAVREVGKTGHVVTARGRATKGVEGQLVNRDLLTIQFAASPRSETRTSTPAG